MKVVGVENLVFAPLSLQSTQGDSLINRPLLSLRCRLCFQTLILYLLLVLSHTVSMLL